MKDITDVIVSCFGRPKETYHTIKLLLKANDDIRLIVVNDGWIDMANLENLDTSKIIQLNLPWCGHAKSTNIALKLVESEYVCTIHNDMYISDKGWIGKAVNFLKTNEDAGLVTDLGWSIIYNDLLHSPYHSISSITKYRNCENHTNPKKDFTEVFNTDNHMCIFKIGIKADERHGTIGTSFWIDIISSGKKCYVMRFNDCIHDESKTADLKEYKEQFSVKEEKSLQTEIRQIRMKEIGVHLPTKKEMEKKL